MPKSSWNISPQEIRVAIGEPIDTSQYAEGDREKLMALVRSKVIELNRSLGGKGGAPTRAGERLSNSQAASAT
jgi:hypothetical protein